MFAERQDEYQEELFAEARCKDGTGDLTAMFFSEELHDIARAKSLCEECPVREACFEAARARREPYGVWGGRLFYRGRVLAVKRGRGRPPKSAVVPHLEPGEIPTTTVLIA